MKELPRHEIEWIARLRREGCTWEYIADEWEMPRISLEKSLRQSGVDPQSLGMPNLPTISLREFYNSPGQVNERLLMKIRGREPLIVMPLSEYLSTIAQEEV